METDPPFSRLNARRVRNNSPIHHQYHAGRCYWTIKSVGMQQMINQRLCCCLMHGQLKATVRTHEEAADSVIVLPTTCIYFTMIGPAIFLLSVILGAASPLCWQDAVPWIQTATQLSCIRGRFAQGNDGSYNLVAIYIRHAVISNIMEQIATLRVKTVQKPNVSYAHIHLLSWHIVNHFQNRQHGLRPKVRHCCQ